MTSSGLKSIVSWRAIWVSKSDFVEYDQPRFYDHFDLLYNLYIDTFALCTLTKKLTEPGQNRIKSCFATRAQSLETSEADHPSRCLHRTDTPLWDPLFCIQSQQPLQVFEISIFLSGSTRSRMEWGYSRRTSGSHSTRFHSVL